MSEATNGSAVDVRQTERVARRDEQIARRIEQFQRKCGEYGEEALNFVYHAALPVALNPEFLHLLRINFFVDIERPLPYEVEFEFLLSSLCRQIDEGLYEIDQDVRLFLLEGLAREFGQERMREVAMLLWEYMEQQEPWSESLGLERAQQLTSLNFLQPDQAIYWLQKAGSEEITSREWFVAIRKEVEIFNRDKIESSLKVESATMAVLRLMFPQLAYVESNFENQVGWKAARAMWQKLRLRLEAKAAGREALADLASYPNDEDYQAALRVQIKKLLKQDVALKRELEVLLQSAGQVSGGSVAVGPNNSQQTVDTPSPSSVVSADVVKTILILTANPKGAAPLRLAEEVRAIGEALTRSSQRDSFKIVQRCAVRTEDLRRALLEHEPYLVHFSGHGVGQEGAGLGSVAGQRKIGRVPAEGAETKQGPEGIVLEDVVGQPKLVSGEALAALFELFAASMEMVLLNSCYSAVQAEEIGKSIPVVVGMRRAIGDRAAITFAQGFYDALFAGQAVEQAFKLGVNSIQLESIPEHLTPVFKLNKALVKAAGAGQRGVEAEGGGGVNVGEMAGGTVVGDADSVVVGDAIDARGAQGVVNRPTGDVNMQFGGSSAVNTGGEDYAGRDINKSETSKSNES